MGLLSLLLEGGITWLEFKAKLRSKLRGVSTPSHFIDMLSQTRIMPGQSLLDYFQTVGTLVMQGPGTTPATSETSKSSGGGLLLLVCQAVCAES